MILNIIKQNIKLKGIKDSNTSFENLKGIKKNCNKIYQE